MIRTLIVDDHQLFREGLGALLGQVHSLEVVGEASNARDAIQLATDKRPQLAIVDLSLPGASGMTLVRELVEMDSHCNVLVLTMHVSEPYVTQAFVSGAKGYALKDQPAAEILEAIRSVADGRRYLAPRFAPALLDAKTRDANDPLAALSKREREVFDFAARGFSNEQMAAEMSISVKTIETHRARINRKLHIHSPGELVRFAAQHGLLPSAAE